MGLDFLGCDYRSVDLIGVAPGSHLLYTAGTPGSEMVQRMAYLNLPRALQYDGSVVQEALLRFDGVSGYNARAASVNFELYDDPLDLDAITPSNNPNGTGTSGSHVVEQTTVQEDVSLLYVGIPILSGVGSAVRSMRLWIAGNWSAVFATQYLDAPSGVSVSKAIAYP